jgi:hypothetical protein
MAGIRRIALAFDQSGGYEHNADFPAGPAIRDLRLTYSTTVLDRGERAQSNDVDMRKCADIQSDAPAAALEKCFDEEEKVIVGVGAQLVRDPDNRPVRIRYHARNGRPPGQAELVPSPRRRRGEFGGAGARIMAEGTSPAPENYQDR